MAVPRSFAAIAWTIRPIITAVDLIRMYLHEHCDKYNFSDLYSVCHVFGDVRMEMRQKIEVVSHFYDRTVMFSGKHLHF